MSTERNRSLAAALPDPLVENGVVVFVESALTIVLVWWFVATAFDLTEVVSSPVLVAGAAYELVITLEWVPHLIATLWRTFLGFVVTMVVGTVLGVLMGVSDFWEQALKDYIIVGLALPSLFAVIFAAMWFAATSATGELTATVAGALIAFPFLTQNVYEAVQDIDHQLVEMSEAFHVSRSRVLRRVLVQSIMPSFFAGARYAFSVCWKITTLAELIAASDGIGYMIAHQMARRSITGVITWTLLFMFVILVFEYGVLQRIETRVFAWRSTQEIAW